MPRDKLKVLVVDDTIVYRKVVGEIVREIPDVEVVGTANNGKIALSRIESLNPDLLILDVEMPEMDGLELLAKIQEKSLQVGAIMLSSYTKKGGELTMKAMELGAFDFIAKPETSSIAESRQIVTEILTPMIKAFSRQADIKNILSGKGKPEAKPEYEESVVTTSVDFTQHKTEVIAIGVSTGGPKALGVMLPKLPADLSVPVLIVQHMPEMFTASLATSLNGKCKLNVVEARDDQTVMANNVYIAPGGKQMKVLRNGSVRTIKITDDPPENSCKPSVDYLFRSVVNAYGGNVTGVIMTGMGNDGLSGMQLMKRKGTITIAQNEETCVVYGMPKEVIKAGIADIIAPLDNIAEEIIKTVKPYAASEVK